MDNTRLRRYLLSMHGQDTVGIMYNTANNRLINVTSKELAAAALEAAEETMGMKDAAWVACDTLKRPEDGDVMTSTERTMPEEYYKDGYDFLLVVSDKSGSEEKTKEKVQEIKTFLQTWYLDISEVITHQSKCFLIFKTEGMRKDNAMHQAAVRKLIQILRYTYTDDEITVKGTDRRCCMYPLPGTPGVDMIPELFSDTKSTYEYIAAFVADRYPEMQKSMEYNKFKPETFNLKDFLKSHNIPILKEDEIDDAKRYTIPCHFEHGLTMNGTAERPATIIQHSTGEISYICTTCKYPHTWDDFRKAVAPEAKEKEEMEIEKRKYRKPSEIDKSKLSSVYQATKHFTMADLTKIERESGGRIYIRTGIKEFDKKGGGLEIGSTSLIVGNAGCGKSTLISQILLNAVDEGYHVGYISKELPAGDMSRWLHQIAAGEHNIRGYDGMYYTPAVIADKIDAWAGTRMMVDDNENGDLDIKKTLERVEHTIKEYGITLYVIDNLMSLDIKPYDQYGNEYAAQSRFLTELRNMAQRNLCHIMLCVHPNKMLPVVQMRTISGSANIRNIVSQAFILHRVDDEFLYNQKPILNIEDGTTGERSPLLDATNIFEIGKFRNCGHLQGLKVPLYYDERDMRLKNAPGEVKHYGWEQLDPITS